jgi:hypothetical protein
MTLETKFNINDLVQHKFQRDKLYKDCIAYEILEIRSINCYTTAQVFYRCRAVIVRTEFDYTTKERKVVDIMPGIIKDREYTELREDELKPCSIEVKNAVLNTQPSLPE